MADFANLNRYKHENQEVMNKIVSPRIVFIGNSITEGWFTSNPAFFENNHFANRGIGGQTTGQLLLRFRSDVIDLSPQIVVINGGINDIGENASIYVETLTFDNIKSMAEIAKANGIQVILTSVLPAAKIPWRDDIEDVTLKIMSLNSLIQQYAEQNNIPYVDYYSQMVDSEKGMIEEFTTDKVHVTPKGYAIMEALIQETIGEMI